MKLSCAADSPTRSEPHGPAPTRITDAAKATTPTTCSTPHRSACTDHSTTLQWVILILVRHLFPWTRDGAAGSEGVSACRTSTEARSGSPGHDQSFGGSRSAPSRNAAVDAGRACASLSPRNSHLPPSWILGKKYRLSYRSSMSGENAELSCSADSATRSEPRRPARLGFKDAPKLSAPTRC